MDYPNESLFVPNDNFARSDNTRDMSATLGVPVSLKKKSVRKPCAVPTIRVRPLSSSGSGGKQATGRKRAQEVVNAPNKRRRKSHARWFNSSIFEKNDARLSAPTPISTNEPETTEARNEEDQKCQKDQLTLDRAIQYLGSKVTKHKDPKSGDDGYIFDGMTTPLRGYQLVAVAMMLSRKRRQEGPHGGILADTPGLGKTLEAFALILANPPAKKEVQKQDGKTCLLVAPSQQHQEQLRQEIKKHTNSRYMGGVTQYNGKNTTDVIGLQRMSIMCVLLTFDAINGLKEGGLVANVSFHRIILDEGDIIKNEHGAILQTCAALEASYKWVMAGSPLKNRVKDALAYFIFIGIDMKEDRPEFESRFGKLQEDTGHQRILKVIEDQTFRRRKDDYFMGQPIADRPKSLWEIRRVSMNAQERALYMWVDLYGPRKRTDHCTYTLRRRWALRHGFFAIN
ncbi:Uu.00g050030.m01.CDS01 [Anthostomella pinea]|uniref:Uu.00g050030.m01.CDS01 n=1 Tax=Anthostomella pinea TaxID=933095 RepID=A0AAI8VD09_9PEZI|nr:Uu.00g050030.m01.CDS01 [Anthostomella pinea]